MESSSPPPRDILILGDGTFEFTKAYVQKYPQRAARIIASDLLSRDEFLSLRQHGQDFLANVTSLEEQGVKVLFSVDATKLEDLIRNPDAGLQVGSKFSKIIFNGPRTKENNVFPGRAIVKPFFSSASKVQNHGHRIYVTIDKGPNSQGKDHFSSVYALDEAMRLYGYQLWAKRSLTLRNGTQRYPGYIPRQANSQPLDKVQLQYIFEKLEFSQMVTDDEESPHEDEIILREETKDEEEKTQEEDEVEALAKSMTEFDLSKKEGDGVDTENAFKNEDSGKNSENVISPKFG